MAEESKLNIIVGAKDAASSVFSKLGFNIIAMNQAVQLAQQGARILGEAWKFTIGNADEAIKTTQMLRNQLENQGYKWEEVGAKVSNFATKLSRLTKYTDEDYLNAIRQASTYTSDLSVQMQIAEAAADLAAAKNIDYTTAVNLLGKASAGLTSTLTRYGIIIDESIPRGEKFHAVLEKIRTQFAGAAATEINTLTGSINELSKAWGEFGEVIGKKFAESAQIGQNSLSALFTAAVKGITQMLQDSADTIDAAASEMFGPIKTWKDWEVMEWKASDAIIQSTTDKTFSKMADAAMHYGMVAKAASWGTKDEFQKALDTMVDLNEQGWKKLGIAQVKEVKKANKTTESDYQQMTQVVMSMTSRLADAITAIFMKERVSLADIFRAMAADFIRLFVNRILMSLAFGSGGKGGLWAALGLAKFFGGAGAGASGGAGFIGPTQAGASMNPMTWAMLAAMFSMGGTFQNYDPYAHQGEWSNYPGGEPVQWWYGARAYNPPPWNPPGGWEPPNPWGPGPQSLPGGRSGMNIYIINPIGEETFIRRNLVPAIERAVRRRQTTLGFEGSR